MQASKKVKKEKVKKAKTVTKPKSTKKATKSPKKEKVAKSPKKTVKAVPKESGRFILIFTFNMPKTV